jgi:hypothetical protein
MFFACTYENRRKKSFEILLGSGEEGIGRMMEGVNLRYIISTYVISQCIPMYNYYC